MSDGGPNNTLGKKVATQNRLRGSIFRAVELLEKNLGEPPNVPALANAAGLSVSHFHQAFREVVGETVKEHLNRLRVEQGAALLRHSDWPSGEIGSLCGFSTSASFCRAFKKLFGLTPLEYREKEECQPFLQSNLRGCQLSIEDQITGPLPTVNVEQWSDLKLICLRFYGSLNDIVKPWQELSRWAKVHLPNWKERRFFGIWFDEWVTASPEEPNYRYECGIVCDGTEPEVPEPFFIREIKAGKVAVTHATGTLSELDSAWRVFALDWFRVSGYQPRERICFEEYPSEVIMANSAKLLLWSALGKFSLRMCLPIQSEALNVDLITHPTH